jgi:hypothetical protein
MKSVPSLAAQALEQSNSGRYEQSMTLYREALALQPEDATLHFNLASVLRIVGKRSEAEHHFTKALTLNPDDAEAWYLRSSLRRASAKSNYLSEIQARLNGGNLDPRLEVNLWYALGKEHEDLEQWSQARQAIDNGATLRRRHLNYHVQDDIDIMQAIAGAFSEDGLPAATEDAASTAATPIFIVSMPRAGSTLLERIIGCHPRVQAAGELNDFSAATTLTIKEEAQRGALRDMPQSMRVSRTQLAGFAAQVSAASVGTHYMQRTRAYHESGGYFIDKLPLNFLNVGLIARALPHAKIIHVHRQRDDHLWGVYRHLFNQAYPFSYDLTELETYFDGYQALMAHWDQVLPGKICHVRYEDLVYQPETTGKRVFEHLALEWDADYLNFHRTNRAPSATGSAAQVREKLNDRSIGRGAKVFSA